MVPSSDVLNSPAVSLLCQLEAGGFELAAVDGRLLIKPAERVPPDIRTQLKTHRRDLVTLIRICDLGVQSRREVFASQLANGASIGRLMMRLDLPYVAGQCFSCGDALPRPAFGRCWRCALAWRLAAGVTIPPMVGEVYDRQRVVA